MKKGFSLSLIIALFFYSCATYQTPTPSLYLDPLPTYIVANLSLEERIITEEAWKNLRQGRGEKAKKIISQLEDKSPFYHVGLGYAYYLLYQRQAAEEYFKAALAKYPDMVLIHLGLAQIYLETSQHDPAFVELREVLKEDPQHPWAKPKYEALKLTKTEEALEQAYAFLREQNKEKSKEAFLKALYYSPESIMAHLGLSEIYKSENNYKNALVHMQSAVLQEPNNIEILKNYGEILFLSEQYKKGLEVYEELQELEPDNPEIQQRLETIKNRLGIFELPSQYDSIPSSEAISKEDIAALISVKFKNVFDEAVEKPPIIIDIATSWASRFILTTTSLGLLDVYPNHTFQPKKVVTRAEMAEILLRLINKLKSKGYKFIQQIPLEKIHISDVSPDNYYYQPILFILSYNIMSLSSDKTFSPERAVTGQEAIKLLNIILDLIK